MENLPGGLTELQNISMSSLKGEAGCGDSDSAASSSGVLSAISRIKTSGSTSAASNTPGRALGVLQCRGTAMQHNGCGVAVEVLVTWWLWMFFSCWKWYISGRFGLPRHQRAFGCWPHRCGRSHPALWRCGGWYLLVSNWRLVQRLTPKSSG